MIIGIMQPYFLPYIGYFQLISAVDVFVAYDNIKYTKKGWINRNRILVNGSDAVISLPLKKDSDALNVVQRHLSKDFDKNKLLSQIRGAYSRAPHFKETFQLLEEIVGFESLNLFEYILHSLKIICNHLEIQTKIYASSDVPIDHDLKSQDKVIAICDYMKACEYINPIGGAALYDQNAFNSNGIKLRFIKSKSYEYVQFNDAFVPWLSIVDVLMFNSRSQINNVIHSGYEVTEA